MPHVIPVQPGDRFGRLTALRRDDSDPKFRTKWLWTCDCGDVLSINCYIVCGGKKKCCGCATSELKATKKTKPGRNTPEYGVWAQMNDRCANPNVKNYPWYGARGIRVCERWRRGPEGFDNFIADMGYRPSNAHTLDRIDSNGHYEPSNCRWVSRTVQGRNKRNNVRLTHNGVTLTVVEWSERTGISAIALYHRIERGWSHADALTTPVRITRRLVEDTPGVRVLPVKM